MKDRPAVCSLPRWEERAKSKILKTGKVLEMCLECLDIGSSIVKRSVPLKGEFINFHQGPWQRNKGGRIINPL